MNRNKIWQEIELELRREKKEYPNWPDHPAAQAGNVCRQAGYLMDFSMQWKYDRYDSALFQKKQLESMKVAAIQTAVAAIRFLENLKDETTAKNTNPIG